MRLDSYISASEADWLLTQESADETYQQMRLGPDGRHICTIPTVQAPPAMNATEKELSKVEEERELARATTRGWELLAPLDGKCLYFMSGWWSYSYCHNREVRQFHRLPPQKDNQWPPEEDPKALSYILGRVTDVTQPPQDTEGAGLEVTGEMRYLVQTLAHGTMCDLTGRPRKVEVQVSPAGGSARAGGADARTVSLQCGGYGPDRPC